jgi:hypothetical protein
MAATEIEHQGAKTLRREEIKDDNLWRLGVLESFGSKKFFPPGKGFARKRGPFEVSSILQNEAIDTFRAGAKIDDIGLQRVLSDGTYG